MSRRILIVDDDQDMVRTLRDILQLRGWETGEAHTAEAAIDLQRQTPFPWVLMDITLPGLDGIAAGDVMQSQPGTQVLLMTAHDLAGRAPGRRVLAKPIDLSELFGLLDAG